MPLHPIAAEPLLGPASQSIRVASPGDTRMFAVNHSPHHAPALQFCNMVSAVKLVLTFSRSLSRQEHASLRLSLWLEESGQSRALQPARCALK